MSCLPYTAVSRKVVGKGARDNPERYCGWFCLPCSPKKFERMAREATDICSRVLMESSKSRLDGDSRYEQCIGHIPYYLSGLSRAHFFMLSITAFEPTIGRRIREKNLQKISHLLRKAQSCKKPPCATSFD